MLVRGFESFVGLYPIPMRHGMTIGELARLFNEEFGIGADLEVVADGGLATRDVLRRRPALPWVLPSPNIPTLDSGDRVSRARCCSKGRTSPRAAGTTRPFELVGAPWVDAERFADALNRAGVCRACASGRRSFEPTFHKHAQASLRRLPDPRARSRGVPAGRGRRGAASPRSARRIPTASRWRDPPYEYEHDEAADRHPRRDRPSCASRSKAAMPARDIARSWRPDVEAFMKVRERLLSTNLIFSFPDFRLSYNSLTQEVRCRSSWRVPQLSLSSTCARARRWQPLGGRCGATMSIRRSARTISRRLKSLVATRADANTADPPGDTLLMSAAVAGSLEAMKLLVDRGADVNAQNAFGATALDLVGDRPREGPAADRARRERQPRDQDRTDRAVRRRDERRHPRTSCGYLGREGRATSKARDAFGNTMLTAAAMGNDLETDSPRRSTRASDRTPSGRLGVTPLCVRRYNGNAAATSSCC